MVLDGWGIFYDFICAFVEAFGLGCASFLYLKVGFLGEKRYRFFGNKALASLIKSFNIFRRRCILLRLLLFSFNILSIILQLFHIMIIMIFFKILQNMILPDLIPKQINLTTIRILILKHPPRPIHPKNTLNQ